MLTLLSKCIDRMNLYNSAAHFGEVAGEEAGAAWKDILNLLYELLGKWARVMHHTKYPHLLSALFSCLTLSRHAALIFPQCLRQILVSFTLIHFLPHPFSSPPFLPPSMPHQEFTAGVSLSVTFPCDYLWQGSAERSKDKLSFVFFFHSLSCFSFTAHPSLRSVWAHYEAFSRMFDEMTASLTKCQPSQVLALYRFLSGGLNRAAKATTLKSFILDNFFLGSLFCCHLSFPINSFPLGSPWLPLYSSPPPACTPTYTH